MFVEFNSTVLIHNYYTNSALGKGKISVSMGDKQTDLTDNFWAKVAKLPKLDPTKGKNFSAVRRIERNIERMTQEIRILNGGTPDEKLAAQMDMRFYKERYERSDSEVIEDILANAAARKFLGKEKYTLAELKPMGIIGDMNKLTFTGQISFRDMITEELEIACSKQYSSIPEFEKASTEAEAFVTEVSEYASGVLNYVDVTLTAELALLSKYENNPNDRSNTIINQTFADKSVEASLENIKANNLVFVDNKIDDISALYAFFVDKAKNKFSGSNYENVMRQADEIFESVLLNMASSFSDDIIGKNDIIGIKDTIMSTFEERASQYIELIEGEGFSADVEATENEWARGNAEFMVHKLHQKIGTEIKAVQGSKYSLNDLKAFALMQIQYNDGLNLSGGYNTKNEESMGMELGFLAVQNEMLCSSGISSNAKALLRDSFDLYVSDYIEKSNKSLESYKDYIQARNLFDRFDEDDIRENMSYIINAFKSSYGGRNIHEGLKNAFQQLTLTTLSNMVYQYDKAKVEARYECTDCALNYLDRFGSSSFINKFNTFATIIDKNSYTISGDLKGMDLIV